VEKATAAIARYRRKGVIITASPEQWLLPVNPPPGTRQTQLPTDQQTTAAFQVSPAAATRKPEGEALCVWMDDARVRLAPHEIHTDLSGTEKDGVRFRGTSQSCRWAYLLQTPRLSLRSGEYMVDFDVDIDSGHLYGGILDIEKDDFIVQEELLSGTTRIKFALSGERLIDVVIRQGADDTPVSAIYRNGRLTALSRSAQPAAREPAEAHVEASGPEHVAPGQLAWSPDSSVPPSQPTDTSGPPPLPSKPARIYCPMVYSTLSVFHHSLNVSICCYMETAPGHRQPSLKGMTVPQAYNDEGFRVVRRSLNTDQHVPVCDSCPYGAVRS
jgi:hypothetical protein